MSACRIGIVLDSAIHDHNGSNRTLYNISGCKSALSNKFNPYLENRMHPSEELRKLEVEANELFAISRGQ
ncbi:probable F-actin-capping protein subunit beta [Tanacetum coccineum]